MTAHCIAGAYHTFADDGFACATMQNGIQTGDGTLSIPLYVRKQDTSEEKGKYAGNGLQEIAIAWGHNSNKVRISIPLSIKMLLDERDKV